jgi:hypothetical protein
MYLKCAPCESKLFMVKKSICYCIFRVYLVTRRGTLKEGQTQFLRLFLGTHIVTQVAKRLKSLYTISFRHDLHNDFFPGVTGNFP